MCVNEGANCLNKQNIVLVCCTLRRSVNTIRYILRHYCISLKVTVPYNGTVTYLVFLLGLYSETEYDEFGFIDLSTLCSAISLEHE